MKNFGFAGIFVALLIGIPFIQAYKLWESRWPQPSTTFYVDIGGAEGLWNSAFDEAMSRWNERTIFTFRRERSYADPCSDPNENPYRNGSAFSDTVCGEDWGSSTLATTSTWLSNGVTLQSGILFNRTKQWSVYSGSYKDGGRHDIVDFRRVAVHELGHALGLDHEPLSIPRTISPQSVA